MPKTARTTKAEVRGARGLTVDDLLAFHAAHFGGARMSNDDPQGDPAPTTTPPSTDPAPQGGDDKPLGPGGEKALHAEREQRKALEKTVADMKTAHEAQMEALAKAFGLKADDVSDTDALAGKVTGLSEQLEKLTRANLVLSVVNDHPGLSEEDKKVVESIPDEATMRTIAARLAAASKPTGKPKADPPSGPPRKERDAVKPGMDRLRFAYDTVGDDN